ncbi:MAG: Y-family DNA polymerase [Deltaproteobacteria bacterium]|nr:Y-family DNA polymerase [Deltaproteobacteria bacterium]
MSSVFALVDCNNFYVSCERVFNPRLVDRPVIVLSNNDGCAVARSNEAKALGIKMAVPAFQIRDIIRKNKVQVFSSNYALYGDMSQRVMQTLLQFTPNLEIYSIDEAFLDLNGCKRINLTDYGRDIKNTVEKWTGIPVSVGIAGTKTLAKIAGCLAKKSNRAAGVLDLSSTKYMDQALAAVAVGEVWGVGRQYAQFLKANGIENALQLREADDSFIRKKMGVVGLRLLGELRGEISYPLELSPPRRKSIMVSRTFKRPIVLLEELLAAVAAYVSSGAEKLRRENVVAGVMMVYLMTDRFKDETCYYSRTLKLPVASHDTAELIRYAHKALREIYEKGRSYKKAGVLFNDLGSETMVQANFLDTVDRPRSKKLMQALDLINEAVGRGVIAYGALGTGQRQSWKTAFNQRSRSYTTAWAELLEVSCDEAGGANLY